MQGRYARGELGNLRAGYLQMSKVESVAEEHMLDAAALHTPTSTVSRSYAHACLSKFAWVRRRVMALTHVVGNLRANTEGTEGNDGKELLTKNQHSHNRYYVSGSSSTSEPAL
jgi:hypothetical protein